MRFACWITKATNAHSEYVILIALPQWRMMMWTCLSVLLYVHCISGMISGFRLEEDEICTPLGYHVTYGILRNIPEEHRSFCLPLYHWDWKVQSKYYALPLCFVLVWFSTMSCPYSIYMSASHCIVFSHVYGALHKQLPFLCMSEIYDWFLCDMISCLVWLF